MNSLNNLNLILASGSPRRKQLLAELGLTFDILISDVDESVNKIVSPSEYVCIVAQRKAAAISKLVDQRQAAPDTETLIISADTTVAIEEMILGKPSNRDEAIEMLMKLQGKQHIVYSAICLQEVHSKRLLVEHIGTRVNMKSLTMEQIEDYVATGEPMDKAGAYAIQGIGSTMISGIEGDYFNVVGLSLSLLSDMLAKMGYSLLTSAKESCKQV